MSSILDAMRDGGPGGSPGAPPSAASSGGKLPDKEKNGGQEGRNRNLLLGVVAVLAVVLFARLWMGSKPAPVEPAQVVSASVLSALGEEAVAPPKAAAPKVAAAKPAAPKPAVPRPAPPKAAAPKVAAVKPAVPKPAVPRPAPPKAAAPEVAAVKPAVPRPTPVVPAPREEKILDGRPMDAPFLGVIFIQWARGPKERLASLRLTGGGMAMVRENDIVNGLKVVRIEREGLVLAWKGQKYREVVERF